MKTHEVYFCTVIKCVAVKNTTHGKPHKNFTQEANKHLNPLYFKNLNCALFLNFLSLKP